jgi:D-3-phosphoglycerate dehydrogenase
VEGRILITDCDHPTTDIERAVFAAAGLSVDLAACRTEADVIAAGQGAVGLLVQYAPIGADALRALPACRVVGRYGVGLDTIDTAAAADLGVAVVNVPDYCIAEVADHALALILALTRGIVPLDRGVQRGVWDFRLAGAVRRASEQRVGLVGLGRIGAALAHRVLALGYDVVASDPRRPNVPGVRLVELDELIATSDVVSLHLPLDATTRHLIDAKALARMRHGAILVNTSRGGLIDQVALVDALLAGTIRGAGLDVLEHEPIDPHDPLIGLSNVVLTPHAAFHSEEAIVELKRRAAERMVEVLQDEVAAGRSR